jgi:hypothetical protein
MSSLCYNRQVIAPSQASIAASPKLARTYQTMSAHTKKPGVRARVRREGVSMSSKSLPPNEPPVNPRQTRSKFPLIPMTDDRAFRPDCDLLSIRYNSETKSYILDSSTEETQYITGDGFVGMKRFPSIALWNIQRIQSRIPRKVGLHPLVSASISYGLTQISHNRWIDQLLKAYNRHKLCPNNIPGFIDGMIQSFLSRFEIDTPKGSLLNPKIHERTDARLTNLSIQLGTSRSALASIAVCITVADQNDTIEDNAEEMRKYIDRFYEAAWVRGTAAKALMDAFDVPELEEGLDSSTQARKETKTGKIFDFSSWRGQRD